jgi:hypothetical protein
MLARRVVSQLVAHAPAPVEQLDLNRLHQRVLRLLDALVTSLQEDPVLFTKNVERLVRSWFVAGPCTEEVLRALSILQLEVWSLAVAQQPSSQERWAVSDLTSCVGAARDELARVFLASDEPPDPQANRRSLPRGAPATPEVDFGSSTKFPLRRCFLPTAESLAGGAGHGKNR